MSLSEESVKKQQISQLFITIKFFFTHHSKGHSGIYIIGMYIFYAIHFCMFLHPADVCVCVIINRMKIGTSLDVVFFTFNIGSHPIQTIQWNVTVASTSE